MARRWVEVLDAAYAPAADDTTWGRNVVEASATIFPDASTVGLTVLQHSADCTHIAPVFVIGDTPSFRSHHDATLPHLTPAAVRELYYPPRIVATMSDIFRRLAKAQRAAMGRLLARVGVNDSIGMVIHPEPGLVAVVFAGLDRSVALSLAERRQLTQVALHIETALRLRRRPQTLRAVIAPDGKVLHAEGVGSAIGLEVLRERTRAIERARTTRTSTSEASAALDTWTALVHGQVSVVERVEGRRRLYFVLENAPAHRLTRALTRRELDVLANAARGMSGKLIAYALGLSPSAVSQTMRRAAEKIGVANRMDALRIAAILTRDPRARFDELSLSVAEREVLALLQQGLSNEAIARMRSRSVRTIANQVASVLRKTNAPSRRALVARGAGEAALD